MLVRTRIFFFLILSFLILQTDRLHAQSGTTAKDSFPDSMTGTWKICLIKDTAAYNALPYWKRNYSVVHAMNGLPACTYELHEDGTSIYNTQLMKDSFHGTWFMRKDTLTITQAYGDTLRTRVYHVKFIDDERMEWTTTEYDADRSVAETTYYFLQVVH